MLSGVPTGPNMNTGTLNNNHGYGPIGTGISGIITGGGSSAQQTMSGFAGISNHMNINVYKQGSANQPHVNQSTIKDSISFSKINAKIKKR